MNAGELWKRFRDHLCVCPSIDLQLDISRMGFDADFFDRMSGPMEKAYAAMDLLEDGAVANPDENRMVGHYWLRDPKTAPNRDLASEIESALAAIKVFASDVHSGRVKPLRAPRFTQFLSIGIGGSALGPMFVADALGDPATDRLTPHFIDNTDPDGMARVLRTLSGKLGETLVLVISKSGGTPEPRNGMITVAAAYQAAGLEFARRSEER